MSISRINNKCLFLGLNDKYIFLGLNDKCLLLGLNDKYLFLGLNDKLLFLGLQDGPMADCWIYWDLCCFIYSYSTKQVN